MWEAIQFVVAYWPFIAGTLGLIVLISIGQYAYKLGGLPALVVAVGAIGTGFGYYLGQKVGKAHAAQPTKPTKRRRPTILDGWRTVFD